MEVSNQSPKVYATKPEDLESSKKKCVKKEKKQKDLYTETPLRKLGFLDEVGEALRPVLSASTNPLVKQLPNFAYIPATAYMIADVADKYQKGIDGTGEKPSLKMAAREAAYQGIVSVAAPIAIVKGVHKVTANLVNKIPKVPTGAEKYLGKFAGFLKNNKVTGNILNKAGMTGKIAGAAISLLALSKLTKPVDFVTKKVFENVVDPLIGVKDKD